MNLTKRCTSGADCIHPDGPELPATTEYFSPAPNGFRSRCRKCRAKREWDRQKARRAVRARSDDDGLRITLNWPKKANGLYAMYWEDEYFVEDGS